MVEIAGVSRASLGVALHSTKTKARWAEWYHNELDGHVFNLDRDGLRQVVPCPWLPYDENKQPYHIGLVSVSQRLHSYNKTKKKVAVIHRLQIKKLKKYFKKSSCRTDGIQLMNHHSWHKQITHGNNRKEPVVADSCFAANHIQGGRKPGGHVVPFQSLQAKVCRWEGFLSFQHCSKQGSTWPLSNPLYQLVRESTQLLPHGTQQVTHY